MQESSSEKSNLKFKISISIILSIYLLFTSGIVYELFSYTNTATIEVPFSYVLSGESRGLVLVPTKNDINCAKWLAYQSDKDVSIMAGYNERRLLASYLDQSRLYIEKGHQLVSVENTEKCYIFLSEFNVKNNVYDDANSPGLRNMKPLSEFNYPIVYQSGLAIVYFNGGN